MVYTMPFALHSDWLIWKEYSIDEWMTALEPPWNGSNDFIIFEIRTTKKIDSTTSMIIKVNKKWAWNACSNFNLNIRPLNHFEQKSKSVSKINILSFIQWLLILIIIIILLFRWNVHFISGVQILQWESLYGPWN